MTHKVLTALWRYSPLLLLAAVWEAVTQAHLVSQYALPTLSGVLSCSGTFRQPALLRAYSEISSSCWEVGPQTPYAPTNSSP